jgi:phosphoglycolate phosphatase-like HAD superfamily hydrolase
VTALPDNWIWRDGPVAPGRTVVVDVDGVVADAAHRQHLLHPPARWGQFFDAAGEDGLFAEVSVLLDLLEEDLVVVLLTARPTTIRAVTVAWLEQHAVRHDLLVMRDQDDFRPARQVKREALAALRAVGFDLCLAIDDDPRNVEMFHAEGVPCLELDRGYH